MSDLPEIDRSDMLRVIEAQKAKIATLEAQLAEAVMGAVLAGCDRIEAALRQEASTFADARITTLEAQLALLLQALHDISPSLSNASPRVTDVETAIKEAHHDVRNLAQRCNEEEALADKAEAQCAALQARIREIALEALIAWDADRDSRVGKLLSALAGRLPGYRVDIDALIGLTAPPSSPSQP